MSTLITIQDSYPAEVLKNILPWQENLRVERREGSNIPSGARKLVRPDGVYHFAIGRYHVQVWSPDGTKYVMDFPSLTGRSWTDLESHGRFEITPHHIAQFVGRGFKPALRPVYG